MKKIVFLSMLFFSMLTIAQENYKVIIMPKKFVFLKEENQYNLNMLCKLFFEKEGFTVYYSNDVLPKEIANNRCIALFLDLVEDNNMFKTKIKVELKDCQNNLITYSEEGESREKNLNKAYNEVTRFALKSMEGHTKFKNVYTSPKIEKTESVKEYTEANATVTEKKVETTNISSGSVLSSILTKSGYNLVDENKNIKFELLKTSNPTIFIAKKGSVQGIFTLNEKNSKFESYQNDVLIVEEVEVKF